MSEAAVHDTFNDTVPRRPCRNGLNTDVKTPPPYDNISLSSALRSIASMLLTCMVVYFYYCWDFSAGKIMPCLIVPERWPASLIFDVRCSLRILKRIMGVLNS